MAAGLRASTSVPRNRERFRASSRFAFFIGFWASYELLQWVKRSRAARGELALSTAQELGVAVCAAIVATSLAHLVRWLWRRAHRAPTT